MFAMVVTFLLAVAFLIWLFALASLLERRDFDPVTKFTWVFVIIMTAAVGAIFCLLTAPVGAVLCLLIAPAGAILYLRIGPKVQPAPTGNGSETHPPADDADEDTVCASCGVTIPAGARVCPKCGWSYADGTPSS